MQSNIKLLAKLYKKHNIIYHFVNYISLDIIYIFKYNII